MASAATSIAVAAGQQLDVTLPAFPSGVTSANVYISATSGSETKQGNTTTGSFTKSNALAAGTALPAANTTADQWKSVVDGTTVPTTNTIAFVSANLAPNYTPYKLSYVLATPVVETVNVEGDIVANGPTQIEVTAGAIVREKVTPVLSNGAYGINDLTRSGSNFKNRAEKLIEIYKGNSPDLQKWTIATTGSPNGKVRAFISQADFDTFIDYYVTYLAFDRQSLTINPLDVDTSFFSFSMRM